MVMAKEATMTIIVIVQREPLQRRHPTRVNGNDGGEYIMVNAEYMMWNLCPGMSMIRDPRAGVGKEKRREMKKDGR